jgi:PAS domain S-box-containing protein
MSVSPLSMVLTDPHRPDYSLIFVNRAFTALTGFSEEEVLGRNCRFLQGPETDRTAVRGLGDAVAVVGEAQIDLWNYERPRGMRSVLIHSPPPLDPVRHGYVGPGTVECVWLANVSSIRRLR